MTSAIAAAPPVGRLAPSPTGELHLGHARSFLIAWWHARARGGRIVLRWEDLDDARSSDAFIDLGQRDLEWLGLDWDGVPVRQSKRREAIVEAAVALQNRGLAYACTCSRADIRQAVSAPHASDEEPTYPGTCRRANSTLTSAEAMVGKAAGLRFRVGTKPVHIEDELLGHFSFDLAQNPGDFLILRRDKTPAYQLSVVVDDQHQNVTEVVRAEDLLSSTPRQLVLQRALGYPTPAYYHLPLVVDAAGKRLAKRDGARSLRSLREAGVDARHIVTWVATSCGLPVDELVTVRDIMTEFDIRRIPHSPVPLHTTCIDEWMRTGRH